MVVEISGHGHIEPLSLGCDDTEHYFRKHEGNRTVHFMAARKQKQGKMGKIKQDTILRDRLALPTFSPRLHPFSPRPHPLRYSPSKVCTPTARLDNLNTEI